MNTFFFDGLCVCVFVCVRAQELTPQLDEIDGLETSVDELMNTAQVCVCVCVDIRG